MLCAVLLSVTVLQFCDPRLTCKQLTFWYIPLLIFPSTPAITDTIRVLTFHFLLTAIFRSLCLFGCSVYFVLTSESPVKIISIRRQAFHFSLSSTPAGRFGIILTSMITGTSHMLAVLLTIMTLSSIRSQYLSVSTCKLCVYIPSGGCSQPQPLYCVY